MIHREAKAICAWLEEAMFWRKTEALSRRPGESFSDSRRMELLACGFPMCVAATFGLRVADDTSHTAPNEGLVLRIRSGPMVSPVYLRDSNDRCKRAFCSVASFLSAEPDRSSAVSSFGRTLFLVNDAGSVSVKLAALTGIDVSDQNRDVFAVGGLSLLKVRSTAVRAEEMPVLLARIGATPSMYSVLRFLVSERQDPSHPIPSTATDRSRALVFDAGLCSALLARGGTPESCATEAIRAAAWRVGSAAGNPALRIPEESLCGITRTLRGMALFSRDLVRCSKLFEVLGDEIFAGLSISRPYSTEDLCRTARSVVARRHPIIAKMLREAFVSSSGMDALCCCFVAGAGLGRTDCCPMALAPERDYVETAYLCCQSQNFSNPDDAGRTLVITPNPSFPPLHEIDVAAVVSKVSEAVQAAQLAGGCHATVVIDATVEVPPGPHDSLEAIVAGLLPLVERGALEIMFAKSLVKYGTLGFAKASAGVVVLANSGAPHFGQSATRLRDLTRSFHDADDTQFIAHILRHAAADELRLIRRASSGASFVGSMWQGAVTYPSLPFVALHRSTSRWTIEDVARPGKRRLVSLPDIVVKLGVFEDRDSFSSLQTSFLSLPEVCRFNVGQESRFDLLFKFGALSSLLLPQRGAFPLEVTADSVVHSLERILGVSAGCGAQGIIKAMESADCVRETSALVSSHLAFAMRVLNLDGASSAIFEAMKRAFETSHISRC